MNDSIGVRLREERERLGLSQTDLAQIAARAGATGSTRQSQSIYEKGERMPDAGYLAALTVEGMDVVYVLTGQRDLEPSPALSPDEAVLLDGYRKLDPDTKGRVIAFLMGGSPPGGNNVNVTQTNRSPGSMQFGYVGTINKPKVGKK